MMPNNKSTSTFLSSVPEYLVSPSSSGSSGSNYSASSLLFCLSLLKDKVNELQNLVGVIVSPHQQHTLPNSSSSSNNYSMAISSMNSTIQEIIVAANSMMLSLGSTTTTTPGTNSTTCTDQQLHHQQNQSNNIVNNDNNNNNRSVLSSSNMCPDNNIIREHSFFSTIEAEALDWFPSVSYNNNNKNISDSTECNIGELPSRKDDDEIDIIELDAADLLARYTHFCHVCGKGFKRDANLRMHMRAHGDEYKTTQALSNPMKNKGSSSSDGNCLMMMMMSSSNSSKKAINNKRYSCPHEGCRWNKKHAKFQPLKSMVCVKNHYKRTHCPKMYVCKRCNVKQFSVLSDLKTHEKHCGDPKWQCSCGTTFSRKDKLMGHVALFVGHTPLTPVISDGMASFSSGKLEQQALQQQIDGSSR